MKPLRSYLLASASSLALVGSAAAADVTVPIKAAPAPVAWSWAGPYAGINVGAAWNNAKFSDLGAGAAGFYAFVPPNNDPFWSPSKAGVTLGAQAGYNWQTGNIVYGILGDMNWVSGKESATLFPFGPLGASIGATSKFDWMATARGRLGVAFSNVLLYGTGGVAFAHFSDAWGFNVLGAQEFSSDKVRTGWTAGGGLEYMLTRNWSLGVEVLYADFGKTTASFNNGVGTYVSSFKHSVSTARAALNWKW